MGKQIGNLWFATLLSEQQCQAEKLLCFQPLGAATHPQLKCEIEGTPTVPTVLVLTKLVKNRFYSHIPKKDEKRRYSTDISVNWVKQTFHRPEKGTQLH